MSKTRKVVAKAKATEPRGDYEMNPNAFSVTITALVDTDGLTRQSGRELVRRVKDNMHDALHGHPFRFLHSEIKVR